MNALQYWAELYSKDPGYTDKEREVAQEAFEDGFTTALDHAADIIETINNPKHLGLSTLIRAIGKGKLADMNLP